MTVWAPTRADTRITQKLRKFFELIRLMAAKETGAFPLNPHSGVVPEPS